MQRTPVKDTKTNYQQKNRQGNEPAIPKDELRLKDTHYGGELFFELWGGTSETESPWGDEQQETGTCEHQASARDRCMFYGEETAQYAPVFKVCLS